MYINQSCRLGLILFGATGLFAFLALSGCTQNATPIVRLTETLPAQTGRIASEEPRPTSTAERKIMESTPHVSPYIRVIVADVEIRFLETTPVQVELVIRGTLPDQCKYRFYSVETRAGQIIKVTLDAIHPTDTSCAQGVQKIDYVLALGRDMPANERGFAAGEYNLTVNDYRTSFSIK